MFTGGIKRDQWQFNWREMDIFKINNSFHETFLLCFFPNSVYLFNIINGTTRKICEICSKLTTPERCQWLPSGVCCQLWTDFTHCSSVSIFTFEHVNDGWKILLGMHNAASSKPLLPVCTAFCIPPARPVWKPIMIHKIK